MCVNFPSRLKLVTLVAAVGCANNANAQTYAPWLRQIGLTNTVASAANWGYGQLLGVVDTGINATHPEFATGQVSQALSSCAAVSFKCSNSYFDDNSHGTAVASIAAGYRASLFSATSGGYTTSVGNLISVAPRANIVAEKVLNSAGSGYSTDVASGVKKAADAGASVINVSITYMNDAATVAAINYAAAKGAFIVWAGGNSTQNLLNGANTTGLTDVALKRIVFAGSVNSANTISSFSNKPGSGSLVTTSGAKTGYSARWIMAPGESILAPITTYGNTAYGFWSGTSMSAPIVSGSLILLQSSWPILKTNGTAANLLLATASDLGAKGVDITYGNGIVNLTQAFQPYGTLTVTKANGQTVAVSALTGSLISSGALGSLSSVQSKLSNYTSFDGYARNFSVNLSGLIKTPTAGTSLNALPSNAFGAPKVIKFTGGEIAFSLQTTSDTSFPATRGLTSEDAIPAQLVGYSTFTNLQGDVTGLGYGVSSSYPFAKALFNNESTALSQVDFDLSGTSGLSQRGYQFSYGMALNDQLRIAAGLTSSGSSMGVAPWLPQATTPTTVQAKIGLSYQFAENLSAAITYSNLAESSSLLGASYDSSSALSLGGNQTDVIGLGMTYRLSRDSQWLFNAEFGRTRGGSAGSNSMFGETSEIYSQAFGVAYMQENIWKNHDRLTASIKQPLRVSSGKASLITADVDSDGVAVYNKDWVNLEPSGREIDFALNYKMPLNKRSSLALQGQYQRDALNIEGNHQSSIGVMLQSSF